MYSFFFFKQKTAYEIRLSLVGSEMCIRDSDQNEVYEGRGPLEAASIGYELKPTDLALRCNIINVQDGKIITHNGGNLETEDADVLIKYLNETLGKDYPDVEFVTGIQYRHLLVVHHGNKHIECAPPHDHPNENWHELLVKPIPVSYTHLTLPTILLV